MASLNFLQAQRLVIKVGAPLLVDPKTGQLRKAWLASVCEDIAALHKQGKDILLVSSGAIALGRTTLWKTRHPFDVARESSRCGSGTGGTCASLA